MSEQSFHHLLFIACLLALHLSLLPLSIIYIGGVVAFLIKGNNNGWQTRIGCTIGAIGVVLQEAAVIGREAGVLSWLGYWLLVAVVLVFWALRLLLPVPVIPLPTGPYKSVGFHSFYSSNPNKQVRYRVYYPSSREVLPASLYADWADTKHSLRGFAWFSRFPAFLFSHLQAWKIPAGRGLPAVRGETFPVYVFSHGLGGTPEAYSAHCIEMASHGFIVCAPHHHDDSAAWRYQTNPQTGAEIIQLYRRLTDEESTNKDREFDLRRRQLEQRATEVRMLLDDLPSNAFISPRCRSLTRFLLGGHSFGGATAVRAAQLDGRFVAVAVADVWMFPLGGADVTAFPLPLLDIQSQQWLDWSPHFTHTTLLQPSHHLPYPGTRHGNFSDFALLSKPLLQLIGTIGHLDPATVLLTYSAQVRSFFMSFLNEI